MKSRSILLIVVAFLLGAMAAGSIGVRVIREVRTDEEATSLPESSTTTVPSDGGAAGAAPAFQVDPTETMISSSALVPTSLQLSGTRLSIEYDLVTRAPHDRVDGVTTFIPGSGFTDVAVSELTHVWPTIWELETTDGVVEGGPVNANVTVARFDVDEGFSPADIVGVRIVEARTPISSTVPFTLSAAEPSAEVVPGITVELLGVSDQGSSTIVQLGIDAEDPSVASAFVRGHGPGWRSAVLEAEGRPRVNLTYVDGELPDPIPLVAFIEEWVRVVGEFPVSLDGVR